MRTVEDLLLNGWPSGFTAASPEMDPLAESGALLEAQIIDARVHALSSTVGLLFELRTALQLMEGNAALLALHGVREFSWLTELTRSGMTAWSVVDSEPARDGSNFRISLDLFPESRINLIGNKAAFYVIDIPNIGEAPPNYADRDNEEIKVHLPTWTSQYSLLQASFISQSSSE